VNSKFRDFNFAGNEFAIIDSRDTAKV